MIFSNIAVVTAAAVLFCPESNMSMAFSINGGVSVSSSMKLNTAVSHQSWNPSRTRSFSLFELEMAPKGGAAGGKKRKRRRRKKSTPDLESPVPSVEGGKGNDAGISDVDVAAAADSVQPNTPPASIDELRSIATFTPSKQVQFDDPTTTEADGGVELPDIRDVLKRKELRKIEEEEAEKQKQSRPKISRKDKAAFLQLLEEQPFADADDSYFEEEEYGTVSALLAEGAKPFLGIPPGPLQVGHFIGALGIILCAFVDYPGFPLTNLPTPLRECLQGGLATIYLINTVLAVLAFFKAPEKGQPGALWAAKSFSVGGLAFDQLTQLPDVGRGGKTRRN